MPLWPVEARAILFRYITATRLSLKSGSYQGEDPMKHRDVGSRFTLKLYACVSAIRRTRVRHLWIEFRT